MKKKQGENYAQRLMREQRIKRSEEISVTVQLCEDAALIAANEMFHLGPTRVIDFMKIFRDTVNDIARLSTSDDDLDYVKEIIDRRLKQIMGDEFIPWEQRYPLKRRES